MAEDSKEAAGADVTEVGDEPNAAPETRDTRDTKAVRRLTLIVLACMIALFAWYLVADRVTPYTGNARVKAFVVPIVPEVAGYISSVEVANNQLVKSGQPLLQIQKRRYELALRSARAAYDEATQNVGAGAAAVKTAQAKVSAARIQLENTRLQAGRVLGLEKRGVVAKARGDQARASLSGAKAQLDAALAELERAKQQLGAAGANNPRIRSALAALEKAQLDLARTTIRAPSNGLVTDLQVDEGNYAASGKPVMTFIAIQDIWLEAYMTENNLGRIDPGDKVEMVFDIAPGRVIRGEVVSLGGGAAAGLAPTAGALPTVKSTRGWLRDPQRFPVVIKIPGYGSGRSGGLGLRVNSQADVIVYTGKSWVFNALGALWIRVIAVLSYVY